MPSRASVSTSLVQPLAFAIAAAPDAPEALQGFYRATDLTPELLADPDARVTPSQLCAAWTELARTSGDPHVALRLAESIPDGAFGIVEYVCRSSPTIGVAITQWVRYLGILNDSVKVGLVEERGDGEDLACVRVVLDSEPPSHHAHELCFALLARRIRSLAAGPIAIHGVDLTHRAHVRDDDAAYSAWFGAKVRFGAKHTQLVLARSTLETKLLTADEKLHAILRRAADATSRETADAGAALFAAQVSRVVRNLLDSNEADVDHVAQKLGLTARSLQRRLRDEGTSFQEVREAVRRELAQRYLDDGLSIAEISFLLGFSEPSAFFRAFKRWTGITPVESRARKRETGIS